MNRRRLALVLALIAVPAVLMAEDALERYDMDRVQAENSVLGAVQGWWNAPDVSELLRTLPPDQQALAVRELGGFVKEYVQSAEFKKHYARAYRDAQPKHGITKPKLDAKALAGKAADVAKAADDAAGRTDLDQDPNVTIRRRLQQFLDETAAIDYDARTTGEGESRRFTEAANEARPALWKMGFRAGRQVTEAARAFAKEWMEELPAG